MEDMTADGESFRPTGLTDKDWEVYRLIPGKAARHQWLAQHEEDLRLDEIVAQDIANNRMYSFIGFVAVALVIWYFFGNAGWWFFLGGIVLVSFIGGKSNK